MVTCGATEPMESAQWLALELESIRATSNASIHVSQ